MRSLLFVLLVACGGGSKSTPPPVSNQPPAAEPPIAQPMAQATKPTCTEYSAKCAIATMDYYSVKMCSCTDKACADKTNEELAAWGTEMAKQVGAAKDEKPDPAMAKRSADIMTKYTECMTKVMMGGTPPPDPCAGGADPCGG